MVGKIIDTGNTAARHGPRRLEPRDMAAIGEAVRREAAAAAAALGIRPSPRPSPAPAVASAPKRARLRAKGDPRGLTLGELEERRWRVAPETARAKLKAAGLRVEGRSAGLIYRWPSIFMAEEVAEETAAIATRDTHPELFDDLLDGEAAASLLGVGCPSTVRRLAASGDIPRAGWVAFGRRGVRRFRPAALEAYRLHALRGRLV